MSVEAKWWLKKSDLKKKKKDDSQKNVQFYFCHFKSGYAFLELKDHRRDGMATWDEHSTHAVARYERSRTRNHSRERSHFSTQPPATATMSALMQ